MTDDKIGAFKGAIEFSDVSEIRIVTSEKSDSYVLVTSKREWELQVESKRELWKAAFLRNLPSAVSVQKTIANNGDAEGTGRRRTPSVEEAVRRVTSRGSSSSPPPPSSR
mmetsp:Transcript_32757/g.56078  ORF Transcript_32757/g.56078 Transcript_32757/m.56078 type:complete len:110 (-) Transcript_32757:60-389(-)